ncbi:hypothetical protein OH77DRAFT_1523806 [Trametes cingulata]|nr:hypothetical protein OH77DRAFT_1523806 [Trametes cingulata]
MATSRIPIPRNGPDLSKHRPKAKPYTVIGRIPLDIGFSMGDMVNRSPQHTKAHMPTFNDTTLQSAGLPAMQLKFGWPGYEKYDFTETVPMAGKSNGQIALAIAGAYAQFFAKALRVPGSDSKFAITPSSPWCLGNLTLRAVHHVCSDIFMAEIEYTPHPRGMMS